VTVLVAGATGVLGRAIIPLLIADQHRVLAIARNASTADHCVPKARGGC
jgi:uncharacterized protein YbjT (DUF2867 family)